MRTTLARSSLAFLLVSVAASLASAQGSTPRQVAAPASDVLAGVVRLPDPAATPTVSRVLAERLRFERGPFGGWRAELALPVDAPGELVLVLVAEHAGSALVEVRRADGGWMPIDDAYGGRAEVSSLDGELAAFTAASRELQRVPAGRLPLRIELPEGALGDGHAWLFARTESDVAVAAHVTTHELVAGRPIAVVARVESSLAVVVAKAELAIEVDGRSASIAMLDDGSHEDGLAGDGLFGALLPPEIAGDVRARATIRGEATGPFERTAFLAFPVHAPELAIDGPALVDGVDEHVARFAIEAVPFAAPRKLQVSAELWGRDASGVPIPVCWLSRMIEPVVEPGRRRFPMTLDLRWIDVADARAPYELRSVRVQDPDDEVVLDSADVLRLAGTALPSASGTGSRAITAPMLTGSSSLVLGPSASGAGPRVPTGPHGPIAIAPALMLVHGYCSSGSIWPAADFTQPKLEFLDPNANRSHDQFAQLLAQRAQSAGLSSFGVVAHSQGGCAALHLLTYYTSALDRSTGPRRIQSLATPYQGTPLASLGAFACGVNNDMTPAGAATWLAGIPTWARNEVFYWTTASPTGGSHCNALTNLFLTDPEDGTVEMTRGQLPGAHSMGHVTSWCHTTGMSFPASYTDHARNLQMDAQAAR